MVLKFSTDGNLDRCQVEGLRLSFGNILHKIWSTYEHVSNILQFHAAYYLLVVYATSFVRSFVTMLLSCASSSVADCTNYDTSAPPEHSLLKVFVLQRPLPLPLLYSTIFVCGISRMGYVIGQN